MAVQPVQHSAMGLQQQAHRNQSRPRHSRRHGTAGCIGMHPRFTWGKEDDETAYPYQDLGKQELCISACLYPHISTRHSSTARRTRPGRSVPTTRSPNIETNLAPRRSPRAIGKRIEVRHAGNELAAFGHHTLNDLTRSVFARSRGNSSVSLCGQGGVKRSSREGAANVHRASSFR